MFRPNTSLGFDIEMVDYDESDGASARLLQVTKGQAVAPPPPT